MSRNPHWRKSYEHEMILSRHLGPGPFPFVLVLDHLKPGFNVGKIYRLASALGVREIHLVNVGPFDTSPARGTVKQTRTRKFERIFDSIELLKSEGYTIFALSPDGSSTLGGFELPEKSAFILGHEEYGVSFEPEDYPEVKQLRIRQYGKVQSLNVSIAAGLVAWEYVRNRELHLPTEMEIETHVL